MHVAEFQLFHLVWFLSSAGFDIIGAMKVLTALACVIGIAGGVVGIVVNFGRFREIVCRWFVRPKGWCSPIYRDEDDLDP